MKTRICAECGKTNPPDSWYCKECGAALSIESLVEDSSETIAAHKEKQISKKEILPIGLEIKEDSSQFSATYPWFSTTRMVRAIPAPFVCLVTSMLLFWGVFGSKGLSLESDFALSIMLLIIAIGLLVYGIWAAYLATCIVFNTTTVKITRDELTVVHSPVPTRGNQIIKCCDISEFSIEAKKEKWLVPILGEGGVAADLESNLYILQARYQPGTWISLLSGPDYEIIHRLKLGLESFLASHN